MYTCMYIYICTYAHSLSRYTATPKKARWSKSSSIYATMLRGFIGGGLVYRVYMAAPRGPTTPYLRNII